MPTMNADELEFLRRTTLAGYFKKANPDKDFPVSTTGINLKALGRNAFHPGQYLHKAELEGEFFTKPEMIVIEARHGMRGVDLSESRLIQVDLHGTRGTDCRNSSMRKMSARDCDMRGVNFGGVDLQDAEIQATKLEISSFFKARNYETVKVDDKNSFWYTTIVSPHLTQVTFKIEGLDFEKPAGTKRFWRTYSPEIVTKPPATQDLELLYKQNSFLKRLYKRATQGEEITLHIAQFTDARLKKWGIPEALREQIAEYRADYVVG